MRLSTLIMMAMLMIFLSGCSTHYVITSKLVISQKTETPPEIVETATYKEEVSNIKTVALKAPSYCSNRSSDQRTGIATSQEIVLGTDCAVDMAEIERALTKASYKVISWTVLEREMETNIQQNLSPLKVAEKLGAQMLFQINSLEKSSRSLSNLGKDEKWEFAYFEADNNAKILGEKLFEEDEREYLKQKFFKRNEQLQLAIIPFVTLDANAIQVKNGESIWFYRWSHSDFSQVNPQRQFIYCKAKNFCNNDFPNDRNSENNSGANSGKASKEKEVYSADDRPEDNMKALYSILLREITDNLISSFSKR